MKRVVVAAAALLALTLAAVAVIAVEVGRHDVAALATRAPARTALMRQREAEARARGERPRTDVRWVPYGRIAPTLRRAVLVAEDDKFFAHGGLDWEEIRTSARRNLEAGRIVRGGSTITQQLAKNVFLGDRRTIDRKLREVLLAWRMERELGKRRILELYLNLIEWGDGVYGVEAAARRHFGVPAAALDARQSVLLAAVVIGPRRYSPTAPSERIERRARTIARRLQRRGHLSETEYRLAVNAPAPAPPDTARAAADTIAATPESVAAAAADTVSPPGPP